VGRPAARVAAGRLPGDRVQGRLKEGRYHFEVGRLECLAVSDGGLAAEPPEVPAEILFANAPRDELEAALRDAGDQALWSEWVEEMTCTLVATDRQRILIDAGAGDLDPGTGRLLANLNGEGLSPSDIDLVVLTHGHPDHIGGLVDADGSSVFANARLVISRDEWAFWMARGAVAGAPPVADSFVESAVRIFGAVEGQLDFVDGAVRLAPGIRCLPAPGHTPGHLAVDVSSGEARLLLLGDALIHPLHVAHPEWHTAFDVDPDATTTARRMLCDEAAAGGRLVQAFHFPFPGLGRIARVDGGYAWTRA